MFSLRQNFTLREVNAIFLPENYTKRVIDFTKGGYKMGRINVEEAAVMMEATPQFVRRMIQQEKVDWGVAVKMSGGRYTYYVSEERLKAWLMKGGFSSGDSVKALPSE